MEREVALIVRSLHKSYEGVPVLRGVDLTVGDGEIHALLGANGAGKSTVIRCLSGAERPDSGTVTVAGRTHSALTPAEARREGIAVIHQTPTVALSLDVAENVTLGVEPRRGPFRRRRAAREQAASVLRDLGSELAPRDDPTTLGNAGLQVIEIAKAMVRNPRVLILDEPTAALTEREVERLAERMRRLKARGLPLLFVTHRLTEALELADRVTVLRDGRVVLSAPAAELNKGDLVTAIAGRRQAQARDRPRRVSEVRPSLEVRGLAGPGFGPVDLTVGEGEIVGLYGLVGAGRTELLETLAGARRATAGGARIAGERLSLRSPAAVLGQGVALVPSDRLRTSIFPTLPAADNVLLPSYAHLARAGTARDRRAEQTLFGAVAGAMSLAPNRPHLAAARYSGGNQQKLVIGRWLNPRTGCRLLLLDEPTDGVDVAARAELYAALRRFVTTGGTAALLASSEPEELLAVADRVIVLARGRISGVLQRTDLDEHTLLELAHAGEQH
jgi:ABC-type sugar transport system ATPase subunit